jgi:hypothetical protein
MADRRITLRIDEDTHQLIKIVSMYREEDVSNFLRRALLKELASLSYFSKERKKALGIETDITNSTGGPSSE